MPSIKIYKVADIIDGKIVWSHGSTKKSLIELSQVILNRLGLDLSDPSFGVQTYNYKSSWGRTHTYTSLPRSEYSDYDALRKYLSRSSYSSDTPVLLQCSVNFRGHLGYFRDRLFVLDREAPPAASEHEEVVLRIKKAVYEEEAELSGLRAAVANMEAAVEFQRLGPRRDQIPEDVKLVVWARDGGRCVRCGAQRALHFDHVIPVARGGSNIAENIQILCQTCNLKKSDRIAMP